MQYCSECRVRIRGREEKCVLCGNTLLTPNSDFAREEIFPDIPRAYESHLAIRILVFISFTAVVASVTIQKIFPAAGNWPIFVIFGLISMWIGLIVVVRKGHNIPKTIIWQVAVVSLLSVFWDWQTGWKGWSLDYLIPIVCVSAELVMYITAKIMKLSIREYITYAMLDCLFGIIPIISLLLDGVKTPYPSILCVAVSIIFLSAIFIFQGENMIKELNKKMHI